MIYGAYLEKIIFIRNRNNLSFSTKLIRHSIWTMIFYLTILFNI